MKALFLCNTYYQVIVAMQIKLTLLRDEYTGVLISDHSVGAENVVRRLKETGVFDSVSLINTKQELYGFGDLKPLDKVKKFLSLNFGPVDECKYRDYDAFIFYNIAFDVYRIIDSLTIGGKAPKLYRMEEGLSSCCSSAVHDWHMSKMLHATDLVRIISRRNRASRHIEGFYCFIPELCGLDFPMVPLEIPSPATNREELKSVLIKTFGFEGFPYDQKYIFFASSLDVDGRPTGESEIVLKTASEVGAENLLVKMHPRDERQIYQQAGIEVMARSSIPWEVVQLCEDLSNRVLLTCTSGAPLTISALLDDGTRGRYIKPLETTEEQMANYRNAMLSVEPTLERLHSLGLCKDIFVSDFEGFIFEVGKEKPLRKEGD